MVRQTKTVDEIICDVCGKNTAYRKCGVCGKDVCQDCNLELYQKTKREKSEWTPLTYNYSFYQPDPYQYQFVDAMCKNCYERFVELAKIPTIIKAYELLIGEK